METATRARVCQDALTAAREAQANVDALDAAAGFEYVEHLRFGLALHVGEVMYGNIGSGNRLDFTCIGPAVNLAARLEKLAARLQRTIILSAEFARHCPIDPEPLGDVRDRRVCRAADRVRPAGSAVKPAGDAL